MIKLIKIGVSWYNRKANLKECTESFLIFLERLKLFDSRFDTWYEGANSRKKAMEHKAVLEYDYIKRQFCKSCDDGDYPEFAFDIGFWNGAKTDGESFSIGAALGSNEPKNWNNNCILSLPYEGEIYEHYLIKENRDKLRELFIDHWNPENVLNDQGEWEILK